MILFNKNKEEMELMNIKDFLIDNYIWIIVIILITIITIIGFLADKKKGDKRKENIPNSTPDSNNMFMNNQQQMQYQQPTMMENSQINNSVGMNYVSPAPQMQNGFNQNVGSLNVQPVVTEPSPVPVNVVPTNNMNQMNNPMPVENVVPRVEQESMYQPLSEQKPIIAPQPIPNFNEPSNNGGQPVMSNSPQNIQNIVPTPVLTINNQMNNNQMAPMVNEPMMNPIENYNITNNAPQMGFANTQMAPSMNQLTTVPQSVNPTTIPTPQPVQPQPIMTNAYNNQQMMGVSNYNQPSPQSHIEATVNQTAQPINFVYGPQNNNQNM
jgi:hypothetical protein